MHVCDLLYVMGSLGYVDLEYLLYTSWMRIVWGNVNSRHGDNFREMSKRASGHQVHRCVIDIIEAHNLSEKN